MKRILFALSLLTAALTAAADDWVSLFNGEDLSGWRVHGGGATFVVEDGAIVGRNGPDHNTFLCTDRDYADFELEFEVKLISPLNSGVQIRSTFRPEERDGRMVERVYGPQIEIEGSPGESGYIFGERAGGWLTPADKLIPHDLFKAGEWNHYRIVAQGPRIQTWINGASVSDLTHPLIFAHHATGFIGLQVHQIEAEPATRKVAWRHIRVREVSGKPIQP
ncbi:3-keto-disaccharide hydrolase [Synoicihabitans lomoniglobus]|uniref:DUF1080 domain-containing protein n=1 Tax=Synoicihabitans lomoniglobus TaxID=2909285 RepID=A0AAE9ZZ58_9BACT|nr:DUF1080 domain-containing protein [Opitutaceae bacterium LMO-M01]WED63172.1 DUF1080 domain-containing protein [Opitutaceae bacterium LMO-M01]